MKCRWIVPAAVGLTCLTLGSSYAQGVVPPAVGDLWGIIVNSGILPTVLAFAWWRSDSERRQLQSERDGITERVITALTTANVATQNTIAANNSLLTAFNSFSEFIKDRVGRGGM